MDAQHLVAGDRLLSSDKSWSEVVSVAAVEKPIKAYNLTVANDYQSSHGAQGPRPSFTKTPFNTLRVHRNTRSVLSPISPRAEIATTEISAEISEYSIIVAPLSSLKYAIKSDLIFTFKFLVL